MALTAPLIALGGFLLGVMAESRWLLVVGAVLGTLSPNGQDAGPFLFCSSTRFCPGALRAGPAVRGFAWYNLVAFASAAAGAAAAGLVLGGAQRAGVPELEAQRAMLLAYAVAGLVLTGIYARLAVRPPAARAPVARPATGALGLGRSRGVVLQLAGLQGLDALAGGFIMQSLVAYWLHLRFDALPEALGALFFGTNLLSALSFLVATRVAERVGLLNTMVFTHLPSNVLLLLVPLMPIFWSSGAMLLPLHALADGRADSSGLRGRDGGAGQSAPPRPHVSAARSSSAAAAPSAPASRGGGATPLPLPVRRRAQDRLRPRAVLPLPPCRRPSRTGEAGRHDARLAEAGCSLRRRHRSSPPLRSPRALPTTPSPH